jgi:hypothetical protein
MTDLPPLPELSEAEQLEQDILLQPDARELVMREAQGIGNVIWSAWESQTLGKRVTTVKRYYDLYDGDTLIGRQCDGGEKHITDVGVSVTANELQVVGTRQRGE